jgi:serine/threonine-protein kinase ATR
LWIVTLSLGDRHGENILLDSTTGDVVHVDFNCLFDKGRTFEVSENVPFRLTHNLVSGLGVTGVEGVFRRASEVSMKILRNNKDSLMSVLETFVHDPLVDWMPSVSKRKVSNFIIIHFHSLLKLLNTFLTYCPLCVENIIWFVGSRCSN